MTDEEVRMVRIVVSYCRKMAVIGQTADGGVQVGRVLALPVHETAQKAAEQLFAQLRGA